MSTIRVLVLFLLLTRKLNIVFTAYSFCEGSKTRKQQFHLLRECQRSTEIVSGLSNFKNVNDCAEMARNSRGLAFNFSPSDKRNFVNKPENLTFFPIKSARRHILEQPEEFYNCIILQCPENTNFTTLVNDSRFDYYSLYANPLPPTNSTCLPGVGIFQFYTNPMNYSSAFRTCIAKFGALAHIVSEARTHAISKMLKAFPRSYSYLKFAYVGLNFTFVTEASGFMTSEWESLNCFLYRAWEPGHPKKIGNYSCVAITKENSWMTTTCERKLPFICEIYASGPSVNNNATNFNCPFIYN